MSRSISQLALLRIGAFLVDALLVALILVIPATIVSYVVVGFDGGMKWVNFVWYSALLLVAVSVLFRDSRRGGRSLGKSLLGLRLVTEDGKPCRRWCSIIRNIPLVVPGWNLLELWFVLRGRPRSGDRLARTAVQEE